VCAADCQSQPSRTGLFCGDGTTTAPIEGCDDHNSMACGTCDSSCNMTTSRAATGFIVSGAHGDYGDGETMTLDDGLGTTIVLEFDTNNMLTDIAHERVAVGTNDDAATLAGKIEGAINGTTIRITATATAALVTLVNQRKTTRGNQAITTTVNDNDVAITDMTGGLGGDCAAGVGCNTNDDCNSGSCNTSMHTCN
jgi:hypothetical protein